MIEGIAFRCRSVLVTLFHAVGLPSPEGLRVDGGAAAGDFLVQCLADVLGVEVERPASVYASLLWGRAGCSSAPTLPQTHEGPPAAARAVATNHSD